jgi:hypothetical protein
MLKVENIPNPSFCCVSLEAIQPEATIPAVVELLPVKITPEAILKSIPENEALPEPAF